MGPWHHVGATMEFTLDKNWIIGVIRWELNPFNVSTWLVAWYSIVAKSFLLIQFHAVWGGASIVANVFPDFFYKKKVPN